MRRLATLVILLSVCASLSAKETEERLAMAGGDTITPSEPKLGQISEPPKGVREMMEGEYSLAWIETYVDEEVKYAFPRQYGALLGSLLPVRDALYGKAVASGPYELIPLRLKDGRYLTLCMQAGKLVSLSVL